MKNFNDKPKTKNHKPGPGFRAELPEPVVYSYGHGRGTLQIVLAVDFSRRIEFPELSEAVKGLVSSFPILACRYRLGTLFDRWVPAPEIPLERIVTVEEAGDYFAEQENKIVSSFIDYESSWPFRVAALNHGAGSRLLILYPHILGDANAGLTLAQALGHWLCGKGLPANLPMDRSVRQIFKALGLRSIPSIIGELMREIIKTLFLPVLGRWDAAFRQTQPCSGRMSFHKLSLTGKAHQGFVATCKKHHATINDGLTAITAMIASRRAGSAFSGAIYTVNGRRYLKNPGPLIANLSGVNSVPIRSKSAASLDQLLPLVANRTGEQKQRVPGLAFSLLPMLFFWWMPHAGIRLVCKWIFGTLADFNAKRLAAMTNVGSMDEYIAPFGPVVTDAWMFGTFQRGFHVPIVMASGFRDHLTVCVSAADDLNPQAVAELADEWKTAMAEFEKFAP